MGVKVYTIDMNGTKTLKDEYEWNGDGLNWGESFHGWTPSDGVTIPVGIDKNNDLSDDFIYFCQHGKYPETKVDHELEALKKRNQQVNERKELLDEVFVKAKYYGGFRYDNSVTIQALLELAIELSPDTDSFCEACYDVIDRFFDDPHSVIDNLPR